MKSDELSHEVGFQAVSKVPDAVHSGLQVGAWREDRQAHWAHPSVAKEKIILISSSPQMLWVAVSILCTKSYLRKFWTEWE